MTDDKAIEAALDAWFENDDWKQPGFPEPDSLRNDMRAAIAAADNVRAEGFDFEREAKLELRCGECELPEGPAECLCQQVVNDMVVYGRRAFAAGLAKGEAERAALVEALSRLVSDQHAHGAGCSCPWCHARAALALVRKGSEG